ncbi:hypothetical protein [Deinococcus multiflagellatus]|uniref:Uncharacterized protein n=1 Tax=Deinococcus multiflagellatus TaxID=1656887 RepID=A0ABW1ZNV2_9DEIO
MTLRWRLTLFYTALLACLLTGVGFITLYLMRANLMGGLDRELDVTYKQFVSYIAKPLAPGEPRLPLDREQRAGGAVRHFRHWAGQAAGPVLLFGFQSGGRRPVCVHAPVAD